MEHIIYICTRRCCQFYHSRHLWLHHCCWPDHLQISCHSNWNFWFCRCKSVWLQAEFFYVSHSFDFWLVPDEGRDLLDEILPNQMIRKLNLILLLKVWWESLSLHDVMKFFNLTVRKIWFIMAGSRKYRQNVWIILDTFPQYWNRFAFIIGIHSVVHFFFKASVSQYVETLSKLLGHWNKFQVLNFFSKNIFFCQIDPFLDQVLLLSCYKSKT